MQIIYGDNITKNISSAACIGTFYIGVKKKHCINEKKVLKLLKYIIEARRKKLFKPQHAAMVITVFLFRDKLHELFGENCKTIYMRFDKCTRKEDPDILASGFDRQWLLQTT